MKSLAWNKIFNLIKRFFIFEWQKKLIALLLASILWYYVKDLSNIDLTMTLPIQFRDLPDYLVVTGSSDYMASFILRGSKEGLQKINPSKSIRPVVNLEGAAQGTNEYKIEIEIDNPEPNIVINLQKERVRLVIDRLTNRIISVNPYLSGEPAEGYIIDDIFYDIKTVNVKGPLEDLKDLSNVNTKPVKISDATNDVEEIVPINFPRNVSSSDKNLVDVHVHIVRNPLNPQ